MKYEKDIIFPVYIHQEVLENIKKFCRESKTEIFGYLIGSILMWNDVIYIIIEESIFLTDATYSDKFSTSQIEGTAGAYQKEFQRLKKIKKNKNLRIIGWWHSHPDFGCFLSSADLLTQKHFFHKSYQVAMVVDPVRNEFDFFTLDNNTQKGYKSISYAVLT